MGYIKSKLLFKILKAFENKLYKSADKIIAISEGIKQKINISFQDKTDVYPFGANLKLFNTHKSDEWKKSNNINFKTLYVFTGAIGLANGVEYLIEAAKILSEQNNNKIHIAIIGQGSAKKKIVSLKNEYSLSNVTIFDSVAVEELNKIYESADAGVILFGNLSESLGLLLHPINFLTT
jgi:glycosyltransferase involved in cell wall biosynthesis